MPGTARAESSSWGSLLSPHDFEESTFIIPTLRRRRRWLRKVERLVQSHTAIKWLSCRYNLGFWSSDSEGRRKAMYPEFSGLRSHFESHGKDLGFHCVCDRTLLTSPPWQELCWSGEQSCEGLTEN